jgi:hypothetical protein
MIYTIINSCFVVGKGCFVDGIRVTGKVNELLLKDFINNYTLIINLGYKLVRY